MFKVKNLIWTVMFGLVSSAILGIHSAIAEEATGEIEEVKVTGSRLTRERDIGTLPVTTFSAEDIDNYGVSTGDELLRSIPQIGAVQFGASTGNGGVNDARGDVSSINLRGVGTGNTLTLLNGRRMVTHPGTQSENFVPVSTVNSNTLPVAGIRSLQILRDGAGAIYGSDAVAGVVNYQLDSDYIGTKLRLSYGSSEGTPLDETTLSGVTGFEFNGGKSHLTASVSYFNRNGMHAQDRDYSRSHDLRNDPSLPSEFIGDTQLDNRSSITPWGEFTGADLGRFHLQPDTFSGCVATALAVPGICVDQGGLDRDLRFDRGTTRSLVSDVERLSLYAYLTHELDNDTEFFGEAIYYNATANRDREQTHNLSAQRFRIAQTAAFNPFGEDVTLRGYRPVDTGTRDIEVADSSFRLLGGLKGQLNEWAWETALLYSEAETNDLARNRIRASAFQTAINSIDPSTAYNIFTGGDLNSLNSGDSSLNPQSVMNPFLVDVSRDSETSLFQFDLSVTNDALFSTWAGNVGAAFGIEYRRETFADDRDDLLDGSTPLVDQITGVTLSGSDVWGSSPTPDSDGSRNVSSAYAEFLLPLIDSGSQYMELQVAGRIERYSDIGSSGFKPKVALFYAPADWLSLRASYSEGFRAPGLPQVTAEGVPRSNGLYDPILDTTYGIIDIRSGSTDLEPEDDTNTSFGIVLMPVDNLTFTVDFWKIEQEQLVAILPGSSHLLYDSLLQSQGSSNPAVIRDAATNEVLVINNDYLNLGVRNIEGIDFGIDYDLFTDFGKWSLSVNAAKLTKFDQEAGSISAILLAAQAAGDPSVPIDRTVAGAGDLKLQDGRPEWRTRIALDWRFNAWAAGINSNYVSEVIDTSTTATVNGSPETLPVDSFRRTNVYLGYSFEGDNWLAGTRVRVGVRNVSDESPPLADELAHGYFGALHSNRGRYVYMNLSKEL